MTIQTEKEKLQQRIQDIKDALNEIHEKEEIMTVIKDIVNEVNGVDLLEKTNRRPVTDAKKMFSLIVSDCTTITRELMGSFIGRDHSSVTAQIREGSKLIECDKRFKMLHEECLERLPKNAEDINIRNQMKYHIRKARKYRELLKAS